MSEIAGLVVAARRSLSYTYAIRFFLKGPNKQAFFDFIQGDLERSLEILNKKMEENWLDKVEYDLHGKMFLSQTFYLYKETVTTLSTTVENHFNKVMQEIGNGLPSIIDDYEDEEDYTFDGAGVGNWTCMVCQVKNVNTAKNCTTCTTPKPNY